MAQLDGVALAKGMEVYVLGFGLSTVTKVRSDGGFSATVPGMGEQAYLPGGYKGRERKVFWQNPVVVTPLPDKALWRRFTTVAGVLYEELRKAAATKKMNGDVEESESLVP